MVQEKETLIVTLAARMVSGRISVKMQTLIDGMREKKKKKNVIKEAVMLYLSK